MLAQRRLQRDLENLQNDLKVLLTDAKEIGLEKLQSQGASEERSAEQFQQIAKRAEETISNLRQQFKQSSERVGQAVEEHPLAALGTALGVGFVLGKLLNLRKSSTP